MSQETLQYPRFRRVSNPQIHGICRKVSCDMCHNTLSLPSVTRVYVYFSNVSCHSSRWGQAIKLVLNFPDYFVLLILKRASLPAVSVSCRFLPFLDSIVFFPRSVSYQLCDFAIHFATGPLTLFNKCSMTPCWYIGLGYPVLRCLNKHCVFHTYSQHGTRGTVRKSMRSLQSIRSRLKEFPILLCDVLRNAFSAILHEIISNLWQVPYVRDKTTQLFAFACNGDSYIATQCTN